MFTASFPFTNTTFFNKKVSSPPCCTRFWSMVSFANTTLAEEEQQQQRPLLYMSSNKIASNTTLYEILGICTTASSKEIKVAYRQLARVSHPDMVPMHQKESFTSKFMEIHAAYCTLSDPEKRTSYDRSLFQQPQQRPLTMSSSGFSNNIGRNWETDQCW